MLADIDDQRPRPDPFAGCGGGVKIIDCAIARVPAVDSVTRRAVGALGHRLVKLSVVQAGEGPRLIDHLCDRAWEGRVLHPIEHHGADRDLPLVRLAARLGGAL